jgi:hypothetical protein
MQTAYAGYSVVYNCNSGAAVLDHEFVSLGMRGGDYHTYQFVIRDQGVIDYLARNAAVNPDAIISDGREVALHFTLYPRSSFTSQGFLERPASLSDGWRYQISRRDNGILFEGTSPRNKKSQWFFESCQQNYDESR